MKTILALILLFPIFANAGSAFDFELTDTKGKKIESNQVKGKATLYVNIATRCGYTGQLDDIEKLYKKYKDKGLKVVGIPSNDFGSQTPENGEEINKFCRLKYGTTFPITKKTPVTGKEKHPLVAFLTSKSGKEIGWNFEKFLVNAKGETVKHFRSSTAPMGEELTKAIEALL